MHFSQELVKVLHGSKEWVDFTKVFHVVAKVPHGRAVERADPNGLDVQVLEVIQLLLNAFPEQRQHLAMDTADEKACTTTEAVYNTDNVWITRERK